MARCHTDCLEKPLCKVFGKLGALVGRYPWWFLVIPLIISVALGSGFYFFEQNEANDIEEQFTPIHGQAKSEREFIMKHFPTHDSLPFSAPRLYTEGTFASFIAVAKGGSVLTEAAFKEILRLDGEVKGFVVDKNNYSSLCAKAGDSCFSNVILDCIQYDAGQVESFKFTYPVQNSTECSGFIGLSVGGVKLEGNNIKTASAVRLDYYLRDDDAAENVVYEQWLKKFVEDFQNKSTNLQYIQVSYYTSVSRQTEFEGSTKEIVPLFSITYFLSIFFSIVSCTRLDPIRNKFWVAALGVISAGLAVLTGFGLLLFCGVSFAINTANAPFLILGIGVDDMFIMLSSWQKTKVHAKIEDRMAATYAEAAASITITTLTDVIAFYIGVMTPFRSVQSFCLYTGTTVLFCFIYNITFFGAVLALNGRRENSNRHWLTFRKIQMHHQPGESKFYGMCCVGGEYDEMSGAETEHPIYLFFKKYYGPFLTNIWTKVFVVLLYAGYLAGGIYGCFQLQEGFDLRNLATDNSYVIKFYDHEDMFFSQYGPRVMVSVSESVDYWNTSVQTEIERCMGKFENNIYVDRELSESWLRTYIDISKLMSIDITASDSFITNLPKLFKIVPLFQQDIELSQDNKSITASRFFIQTKNVNDSIAEKNMMTELRDLAESCTIPLQVYHSAFIYFDQYLVIQINTIQNVVVAAGAMLVVALLLIPNPICSVWVTLAVASILAGVAGFMALWDVNLDSISMINLVICIGFSVDFTAHISYAFVSNEKASANERTIEALYTLGYPIIQGALSTILGVVVLAAANIYIFRTFFKIMFLVILFGAIHGIVFMPVFLTFFGICGKRKVNKGKEIPIGMGSTTEKQLSIDAF
ncbi:patched domain-containing protein 3-like [Callorhinchus milii]|uniref:patched domain-containing protein 3-like n=1 Tax=Callorhinchus milii TaxID=7868 RepID=UPI001C3FBB38|nr:patched domain-containing protein 3-like [Callorhinchus milii]